jgi:hypothetical protein
MIRTVYFIGIIIIFILSFFFHVEYFVDKNKRFMKPADETTKDSIYEATGEYDDIIYGPK